MTATMRLTEGVRFDQIEPDAYTAATYTTSWLSMRDYDRVLVLIQAGTLGSSATLNAKIEQAKDSGGSGAKDVSGKAIAALTQAGSDSDKMAAIELQAVELDGANRFDHIRLSMTVGTATSDCGAVVMRYASRYTPVPATNLDEVVA